MRQRGAWRGLVKLLPFRKLRLCVYTILALAAFVYPALAANQFTARQLDAFAERAGKIYWIKSVNGKLPLFRAATAALAAPLGELDGQSFEIINLTGRTEAAPYYRVRFESGKEGFIRPQDFHEELNASIVTSDPYASEKKQAEEAALEEKSRVEWIQSQPWAAAVKQAALKKQVVPGLTAFEVRKILGAPIRIIKARGPLNVAEERWQYADGRVLTFHNGLLARVELQEKK